MSTDMSTDAAALDRLWPEPAGALDDDAILAAYAPLAGEGPWVRFNFVSSVDGSAAHRGTSGALGDAADQRVFALLRRHADVIILGAGTVRAEGYDGELVSPADAAWRVAHGRPAHPALAVLSGRLALDPEGDLFRRSPVRPIVYTVQETPQDHVDAFAHVADVVRAGERMLDAGLVAADLASRGHRVLHSEGGPHVLGTFGAADVVNELCVTISPLLAGGTDTRIAVSEAPGFLHRMALAHVLRGGGGSLLLRYLAEPE